MNNYLIKKCYFLRRLLKSQISYSTMLMITYKIGDTPILGLRLVIS